MPIKKKKKNLIESVFICSRVRCNQFINICENNVPLFLFYFGKPALTMCGRCIRPLLNTSNFGVCNAPLHINDTAEFNVPEKRYFNMSNHNYFFVCTFIAILKNDKPK